jgi:hypothetical protein
MGYPISPRLRGVLHSVLFHCSCLSVNLLLVCCSLVLAGLFFLHAKHQKVGRKGIFHFILSLTVVTFVWQHAERRIGRGRQSIRFFLPLLIHECVSERAGECAGKVLLTQRRKIAKMQNADARR